MGEAKFGLIDGVLATYSGWLGPVEVVHVTYDPTRLEYAKLASEAARLDAAQTAFVRNDRERAAAEAHFGGRVEALELDRVLEHRDTKYQLQQSSLRFVPLTPLQATRLNADRTRTREVLSPDQLELWECIRAHPDADWKAVWDQPIEKAWKKVLESVVRPKLLSTPDCQWRPRSGEE